MELRYLFGRFSEKILLFIVLPEEEAMLREKFTHIFISGRWVEDEGTRRKIVRLVDKVSRWVVTSHLFDSNILSDLVCDAHVSGAHVGDLEEFLLEIDPTIPANSKQVIHLLATHCVHQGRLKLYTKLKYILEPIAAFLMLLVLSPVLLLVAIAVKWVDGGPIFYSQERVGYRGRIFKIYKFRSMIVNSENGKAKWASASKTDPNLTSIGNFLRGSHLDELPQLWNVLRGDVSFVGPRPERPEFVSELSRSIPLFKLRTFIKPGITGWAQVNQGYANSVQDSLKKLELDLFYILKHSPFLDFKILAHTVSVLLHGGTEKIKRDKALAMHPVIGTVEASS